MNTAYRPGDVYRYDPEMRHCREGLAIVTEDGRLIDTYWDLTGRDFFTTHTPTAHEMRDASLQFNINDLRPATRDDCTKWYPAGTVFIVTSQHGLREHVFVVLGTQPSTKVILDQARDEVRRAEERLESAGGVLVWAQRELSRLEDGGAAELAVSYRVDA